ncbi:MAG: transposase domain-containing protein [bacterium]|nr:transposase domain-containing protein [bacterium]MDE0239774.1 transposase domain-containing protein [bacterium]MDE0416260.1 transposase domain-containing protein [bacterium]
MNRVEPFAWLKTTLEATAAGHPDKRNDDLMPRAFNPSSTCHLRGVPDTVDDNTDFTMAHCNA